MSKRLISGTASLPGRNIFIHPGNSSMVEMSYGRIRLGGTERRVSFTNEGQETGLICVRGTATVTVGQQNFAMQAKDALYVSKGLPVTVETALEVDLVECSAKVDGDYPVQFVPYTGVQADAKLHFLAGSESSKREIDIMLGTNVQAGRLVVGVTSSLARQLDELASARTCRDARRDLRILRHARACVWPAACLYGRDHRGGGGGRPRWRCGSVAGGVPS